MSHVLAQSKAQSFSFEGAFIQTSSGSSLFLINSAPFSLRGLDFGNCVCRSLGRGPRLTGFGQGCQRKSDVYLPIYLSIYIYIYIYLSISLSISDSIYLSISLSIYLHRQAGRTFGACGRREKHPLDRTWYKYSFCYVVNLAGIPAETQSKFMHLNSCHFRFSMDFASCGLSALYVGPCLHSSAQCPLSK